MNRASSHEVLVCSRIEIDCAAANVNIALRIRHLYFVLLKLIVNGKVDRAREFAPALDQRSGPCTQLELEPVFAELYKPDDRSRSFQNVIDVFSRFKQCLFDFSNIHAVGNTDGNSKAYLAFAVGPIHNIFRDQFRIGNDDIDVVVR